MEKRDESLMMKAELCITNARAVQAIGDGLRAFGYGPERIDEGSRLVTKARQLDAAQQKEYGEQYQATVDLNDLIDRLNVEYKKHLQLARIAMPNDAAAFAALQMGGPRKKSVSGCIAQVGSFYTNLLGNTTWQEAMKRYGADRAQLDVAQVLLRKAEQAYALQMKEMGDAQSATKLRDEAIDAVQAWYSPLAQVARIAFAGQPQLLEMLGISAR